MLWELLGGKHIYMAQSSLMLEKQNKTKLGPNSKRYKLLQFLHMYHCRNPEAFNERGQPGWSSKVRDLSLHPS